MTGINLAVALEASGPEAFEADHWTALAAAADDAELDLVTLEDSFGPPAHGGGRPDAVLTAARIAPVTRHIGLIPVATTTHTEPFHLATALATLDHVSYGRGGWQAQVSARPEEAALLGLRPPLTAGELYAEAADAVEVVRRLWDSWEDDAVIRDVSTGRYIDREKLHYIDFTGQFFAVKGPSIVPRPPQGQPVVATRVDSPEALAFARDSADLIFVDPSFRGDTGSLKVFADATADDDIADLATRFDGVRLHGDIAAITRDLVPRLRERGHFQPRGGTLRERLGLPRATNRYAPEASVA